MAHNPKTLLFPTAYWECFHLALRRVSICINHRRFPQTRRLLSRKTFDLRNSNPAKPFYRLNKYEDDGSPRPSREAEGASLRFYSKMVIRPTDDRRGQIVDYDLTRRFFEASYKGLHSPDYPPEKLNQADLDRSSLSADCATNYIVRNLWHNYVHCKLQGINHENFRDFAGEARFESDFAADNLSNIFLVHSYGLPLNTSGWDKASEDIKSLLRRNRCNSVFGLRARSRGEKKPNLAEKEWRYCRNLSNYISGFLISKGRTAMFLRVDLKRKGSGHFDKQGDLIVCVNGIFLPVDIRPQLGLMAQNDKSGTGQKLRAHFRDVARSTDLKYRKLLDRSASLKKFAKRVFDVTFQNAGLRSS